MVQQMLLVPDSIPSAPNIEAPARDVLLQTPVVVSLRSLSQSIGWGGGRNAGDLIL